MPYFPLFVDLTDKRILVVGGGKVATHKVKKLLQFGAKITIVAPKVSNELKKLQKERKIKIKRRRFLTGDLKNKDLVVVATDDIKLQERIYKLCTKKGILCNTVDVPEYCSFIFGSTIVRGDLVVAITTSGKAPALSKELRKYLERVLPEDIENLLKELHKLRKKLPKGTKRQKLLTKLAKEYFQRLESEGEI